MTTLNNPFLELTTILRACETEFNKKIGCLGTRLAQAVQNEHKLFICGNGGSAAQSQHFAAELLNQYNRERDGLPAIALTTDTSTITAIGNDHGYDNVFFKPFKALRQKNDILICLTTSGNSGNILRVIECANTWGNEVILLTGGDGGDAVALVPQANTFIVPSASTARIQEVHNVIIHGLCEVIDKKYFDSI